MSLLELQDDRQAPAVMALRVPTFAAVDLGTNNCRLLVARPTTYTGDAVILAGGRFGLDAGALLAQVSPEAVLNADPDVLLFAGNQRDFDELIARPGWQDMRAVRMKRAYAVSRAELLIPGPRTIDGIEHLAELFHPKARTP